MYVCNHKDISIVLFSVKGMEADKVYIKKDTTDYLPLPLKRIIHYKDEFINKIDKDSNYYTLNEDGVFLFDNWLSDREIPLTRDNYKAYIEKGSTPRKWMLENNAISFTDCYWICEDTSNLEWKDICKIIDSVDVFLSVKDKDNHYKPSNVTLGGQLEKFWYKENNKLKLCKKTEPLLDILNAREVIASLIYEKQGFNCCKYDFLYNREYEPIGVTCDAFTDKNTELITAYDLLEEYNFTQQDEVYELIPVLADKYGLDKDIVYNYLDMQTMVDFLILNRDRHQGNIGFLRDSSSLNLKTFAPVFDSGSCKMLEAENTERLFLRTKVNGLYNTDGECLSHVRNINLIDTDKLPDREELKQILEKCVNISAKRINILLDLYDKKTAYLKDMQKINSKDTIKQDYLITEKQNQIIEDFIDRD